MSRTESAGRSRASWLAGLVAVLVGTVLISGCDTGPVAYAPGPGSAVRDRIQVLLNTRARAVRTHDESLFLSTVDPTRPALVRRERRYYADLVQLPISTLDFRLAPGWWPARLGPRGPGIRLARIRQTLRLRTVDPVPEVAITGLAIGRRDGGWRVVADRDRRGGFFPGYAPQPWDLTAITVARRGRVLGIFDPDTRGDIDQMMTIVRGAVRDDQSALPFSWSGAVAFYCFGDPALLASFRDVPGGDIRHLGALTFPVYADPRRRTVAAYRFLVLAQSVAAGRPYLSQLVRHELTHVALGRRDDGAPRWFVEGIAEYVAARPMPLDQRRIAAVAPRRAAEPVTGMPASSTFNGPDQDWNYALSWMACDYLAATQGEQTLWDLMEAFHNGGLGTGSSQSDVDAVLRSVTGLDQQQLAERAAARIRSIYG